MADEPAGFDAPRPWAAPGQDASRRLRLQSLELLLTEQRFRIGRHVSACGGAGRENRARDPQASALPGPATVDAPVLRLLDSLPVPVTIIRASPGPVPPEAEPHSPDAGSRVPDFPEPGSPAPDLPAPEFLCVGQNRAAREYGARHLPPGALPPWTGPVPLFERLPTLVGTAVPRLLTQALRTGRSQGPEPADWPLPGPGDLTVRVSSEVRVTPCGDLLLLSWERGHESLMAQEAQRLVGVSWAEWSLGDGGVEASSGFAHALGLSASQPPPGLLELGRMVAPESLDALYRAVHDVLLGAPVAECDLRLAGPEGRILRFVAEPVRPPSGPVWAVRAVLHDVTADRRSRALAEQATREARAQRERADAVAEVAERLRDAVLPAFPAELARHGVEAAAAYRPEAGAARVGGDWYKTRVLPSGKVLIALGDARGHGLEAVTLMAKLRYALAGLAYTGEWVERLTGWLNTVACDDGEESTATAVIARFHPDRGLLRWTCAGHPPPVLVRGGEAVLLGPPPGGPGMPLGVLPDETYTAAETWLRPGDVVLLYSDGLIERRGSDLDRDSSRLLRTVADCAADGVPPGGEALDAFVRDLVARLTGPQTEDDATVLAFRVVAMDAGTAETGTGTRTETDAGTGTGTDGDTATRTETETDTRTGTDPGTGTGAGPGAG
ncbi:PP2C family protein-serine/threonine phosphatase [Streptomyces sp. NRRL S-340]|uniref:PP2C family protein-serine/threonine phosphatase n=1 Tax=Streptomyces sp. NRRL S-340 TaxID=1463901 RepID=UPI00099D8BFF|nr:PP2C family protein-serine/threonine phosphatase [Streptomyces sp. NRRL S-340]